MDRISAPRWRRGLLVMAALALPATTVADVRPGPTAPTVTGGSATTVEFDLYRDSKLVIGGTVNGVATPIVLDSGAGMSVIDGAAAKRLGLTPSGVAVAHGTGGLEVGSLVRGLTVEVAGVRLAGLTAIVLDLSPLERALGRRIPFVMGRELFVTRIVTIDFPNHRLAITDPAQSTITAGAVLLKAADRGGLFTVPVTIGTLPPIAADLDLGNGGAVLLSKKYARDQPQIRRLRHASGEAGGVGGVREIDRVTLPLVRVAGLTMPMVPAEINRGNGIPLDGVNLGIQLLRNFQVTLDLGHRRVWLLRAAETVRPPKDRAGLRLELDGSSLVVAYVSPQGPARAAGLMRGDRIVSIDGRAVDSRYYATGHFRWTNGAAGEAHRLRLASGAERVVRLADYF